MIINKTFGVRQNRVVFKSFGGLTYSDNPRAISEELHKLDPSLDIYWIFKEPLNKRMIAPNYIKSVKSGNLKELRVRATSKFWIDNFPINKCLYKSKDQLYIQTWHGDRGFKKVLYDNEYKTSKFVENEICDLALSSSNFGDRVYRSGFKYQGEILKYGSPRNDKLVNQDWSLVKRLKGALGIKNETKILLFAPTFRNKAIESDEQQINDIDLVEVVDVLEKTTGKEWICLFRAHNIIKKLSGVPIDPIKYKDVTDYEDMSELLLISDFLITDYSSSAGDFALLKRPIILFQNDREDYLKFDREFYFDIDRSPFLIAKNQKELVEMIGTVDVSSAEENCEDILKFYETVETGKASRAVGDFIIQNVQA